MNFEECIKIAEVHQIFESVIHDSSEYVDLLTEEELDQNPNHISNPRWQVLLHLINQGTDHRSTLL